MARARNIKPGFFVNEKLVELPYEARLMFIGLWTLADREGRLEDRPTRIKMTLFPADAVDADDLLQQLHDAGFILRYEVDGRKYIEVTAFTKHQNPHYKEAASVIPAPPSDESPGFCPDDRNNTQDMPEVSPGNDADEEGGSRADSLNLIPDSLNRIPDTGEPPAQPEEGGDYPSNPSVHEQRFNQFWRAYPKRKSKGQAERAWNKIKPSQELTDRMVAAIAAQEKSEQWRKNKGQYIPYPATWLNSKGWLDNEDVEPSKPASEMTEAERIQAEIDEENREKRMYGAERVQWFMAKHARLDEIEKEQVS